MFPVRLLRSTVITRFPTTMSLSDSHAAAARAVIDSRPALMTSLTGSENSISSSRPWVSQVPRLIFARALSPLTPEGSSSALAHCFPDDARLRLFGSLATFIGVTRPKRVRLRYGSRARLARLRTPHYWIRTLAWLPVKRATTGLGHFTQPDQPGLAWRTKSHKKQIERRDWRPQRIFVAIEVATQTLERFERVVRSGFMNTSRGELIYLPPGWKSTFVAGRIGVKLVCRNYPLDAASSACRKNYILPTYGSPDLDLFQPTLVLGEAETVVYSRR